MIVGIEHLMTIDKYAMYLAKELHYVAIAHGDAGTLEHGYDSEMVMMWLMDTVSGHCEIYYYDRWIELTTQAAWQISIDAKTAEKPPIPSGDEWEHLRQWANSFYSGFDMETYLNEGDVY